MANLLRVFALAALVVATTTLAPASTSAKPRQTTYTLIPGDNLWTLSQRFDVSMDDIKRWNPRLFKDGKSLLLPGRKLKLVTDVPVRQPRQGSYTVLAGDTPGAIAKKLGVTVRHLLTVNDLEPTSLKVGRKLTYYTVRGGSKKSAGDRDDGDDDGDPSDSESVGLPNRGRLVNGEPLVEAVGLRVKSPQESYGTNEVVETLFTCGQRFHKTFPKAHGILIGDISQKGGGHMRPHKSHQSGLDVDVGHVRLGKHEVDDQFTSLPPSTIDVKRTWAFLKCLIDSKRVARVYMNASVQKVFRAAAEKKQIDVEPYALDVLFQYGSNAGGKAFIQSIGGHVNHFHVRFRCDADDKRCREKDVMPNT